MNMTFYEMYFKCSCPTTENLREAHRNKRDYMFNIEKAECLKRKYTREGNLIKVAWFELYLKKEKEQYKKVYKHEYPFEMQPCERQLFLEYEDKWNDKKK